VEQGKEHQKEKEDFIIFIRP